MYPYICRCRGFASNSVCSVPMVQDPCQLPFPMLHSSICYGPKPLFCFLQAPAVMTAAYGRIVGIVVQARSSTCIISLAKPLVNWRRHVTHVYSRNCFSTRILMRRLHAKWWFRFVKTACNRKEERGQIDFFSTGPFLAVGERRRGDLKGSVNFLKW